jgi:hypothetical protein
MFQSSSNRFYVSHHQISQQRFHHLFIHSTSNPMLRYTNWDPLIPSSSKRKDLWYVASANQQQQSLLGFSFIYQVFNQTHTDLTSGPPYPPSSQAMPTGISAGKRQIRPPRFLPSVTVSAAPSAVSSVTN